MSNSDLSIEFLQTKDRIIKERLIRSIKNSCSLKAAVAYFNVNHTELVGLSDLLNQADSFICVDIGLPTELSQLKKLDELCKSVYLFHSSDFFCCLHTKLLLFTLRDENSAEIWVGSQNFTSAAINGSNYEATCVITVPTNSLQYKSIEDYLHSIRGKCNPLINFSEPELSKIQQNYSGQQQRELTVEDKQQEKPKLQRTLDVRTKTSIAENGVIEVFSSHSNDNQKNKEGNPSLRKLISDSKGKTIKISTQDNISYNARVIVSPTFYTLTSRDGSQSADALRNGNIIREIQGYVIRIGSLYPVYFPHTDELKTKIDNWLNTQSNSIVNFVLEVENRQNSNDLFVESSDNQKRLYDYYESVLDGKQSICNLSSYDEQIIRLR